MLPYFLPGPLLQKTNSDSLPTNLAARGSQEGKSSSRSHRCYVREGTDPSVSSGNGAFETLATQLSASQPLSLSASQALGSAGRSRKMLSRGCGLFISARTSGVTSSSMRCPRPATGRCLEA